MSIVLSEQDQQKIVELTTEFITTDADDSLDENEHLRQASKYLISLVYMAIEAPESIEYRASRQSLKSKTELEFIADRLIATMQEYWDEIRSFVREKSGVDLYKWTLMAMLQVAFGEGAPMQLMLDAVNRYLDDYEAANAINTVDDLDEMAKTAAEMGPDILREYFELMGKLGVFRTNRDDYKTDEERKMHDRIMEIYTMIKLT